MKPLVDVSKNSLLSPYINPNVEKVRMFISYTPLQNLLF